MEVVRPHSVRVMVPLVVQGMVELVIVILPAYIIQVKVVTVRLLVIYLVHDQFGD
jgi:hypothetical protein